MNKYIDFNNAKNTLSSIVDNYEELLEETRVRLFESALGDLFSRFEHTYKRIKNYKEVHIDLDEEIKFGEVFQKLILTTPDISESNIGDTLMIDLEEDSISIDEIEEDDDIELSLLNVNIEISEKSAVLFEFIFVNDSTSVTVATAKSELIFDIVENEIIINDFNESECTMLLYILSYIMGAMENSKDLKVTNGIIDIKEYRESKA